VGKGNAPGPKEGGAVGVGKRQTLTLQKGKHIRVSKKRKAPKREREHFPSRGGRRATRYHCLRLSKKGRTQDEEKGPVPKGRISAGTETSDNRSSLKGGASPPHRFRRRKKKKPLEKEKGPTGRGGERRSPKDQEKRRDDC